MSFPDIFVQMEEHASFDILKITVESIWNQHLGRRVNNNNKYNNNIVFFTFSPLSPLDLQTGGQTDWQTYNKWSDELKTPKPIYMQILFS